MSATLVGAVTRRGMGAGSTSADGENGEYMAVSCEHGVVVAFPPAGGGAGFFGRWRPVLAAHGLRLAPVVLPGRETRLAEPLVADLQRAVAEGVATAVAAASGAPTVLLGHSFGAVLAYLTALALENLETFDSPLILMVLGRRPPGTASLWGSVGMLSDEAVVELVTRLGGLAPQLRELPDFMQLLLPALRSDFLLDEAGDRASGVVDCPVIAGAGRNDPLVSPDEVKGWQRIAGNSFAMHSFEGGHFFVQGQLPLIAKLAAEAVKAPPMA